MPTPEFDRIAPDSPEAFFDRELSWLAFARRVLALVEDGELPLLERVKFCGIMGMLHDEFYMKRVSGMKDAIRAGKSKRSLAGLSPERQLEASRQEIAYQVDLLERVVRDEIRPALAREGIPILDYGDLEESDKQSLRGYFSRSVLPILTPLAVDAEHPFPFISNDALNIGAWVPVERTGQERFVRVKVPDNRPRWVPLDGEGVVPLEQVIAANLDLVFAGVDPVDLVFFRVTQRQGLSRRRGGAFAGGVAGARQHHSSGFARAEGAALRRRRPPADEPLHGGRGRRVDRPPAR